MNEKKKDVAFKQGKMFSQALELMKEETVWGFKEAGDLLITVACEEAEGLYVPDPDSGLKWEVPDEGKNQHVEVVVQDKNDGRFIPNLEIFCKILTSNGGEVGEARHNFLWHPFLYHYGKNWQLPGEGDYLFQVTINQPAFGRHDEENGKRFIGNKTVLVGPLHIIPGRKVHGPE